MHAAAFHRQPLLPRHPKPLVVVVRYLTVLRGGVCAPIAGIVAALTALDADEFAGAGQRGKAQLWQTNRPMPVQ